MVNESGSSQFVACGYKFDIDELLHCIYFNASNLSLSVHVVDVAGCCISIFDVA